MMTIVTTLIFPVHESTNEKFPSLETGEGEIGVGPYLVPMGDNCGLGRHREPESLDGPGFSLSPSSEAAPLLASECRAWHSNTF